MYVCCSNKTHFVQFVHFLHCCGRSRGYSTAQLLIQQSCELDFVCSAFDVVILIMVSAIERKLDPFFIHLIHLSSNRTVLELGSAYR